MSVSRNVTVGIVSLVVLAMYFFWYMSPYEQCVRAEAAMSSERLIQLRDEQERLLPGEYQSDREIRDKQRQQAIISCSYNSN